MSGQRSHRHMIYRPRRRCWHGNPLWKTNRSSPKAHPSNRSIHPNRLPQFCRSRLFRKRPRSRRSASRSRLAAANRPHLSSHHRRNLCQWSSPPAIREKPKPSVAPREKSWRGVSIRTIDTEQISTPKVQPKTPASKTAAKRARKSATQDAQRKML